MTATFEARGGHDGATAADPDRRIAELDAALRIMQRERNGLAAQLDVIGSDRARLAASHAEAAARIATIEAMVTRMLGLRIRSESRADRITTMTPPDGLASVPAAPDAPLDAFISACLDHAQGRADALRHERDDLEVENRRLRHAVTQLRAENSALNNLLAPRHAHPAADAIVPTGELMRLRAETAAIAAELAAARGLIDKLRLRLAATYRSSSWRLTRPLRGLFRRLRGQRGPDWDFESGTEA